MKAYVIKDPKGRILVHSVYPKKSESIISVTGVYLDWKKQYSKGYRCVPVEITEITDKKA